ncbi:hypothetical protein AAT17_10615 [Nonlabens sp. MIC269]|uniref:hypothetical protein n=1 Tax=Nonlabens TaxID=363408 RepID=UPI00071F608D|nr:hypothetical protein [Nonlabens sp. MIC269]ALM21654.1 hypothetical protein AAT17_10615 [Nonlabens sp. MIC269]
MKNIILIATFFVTAITVAQRPLPKKGNDFTPQQRAELKVKKMAVALDLSDKQINSIQPLIANQELERQSLRENREEMKNLSNDEKFNRLNTRLDKKLDFKRKMKSILTADQYEKWQKMHKRKRTEGRKKHKRRRNE